MNSFLLILNTFKEFLSLFTSIWWVWLPVFLYFISYFVVQNYTSLKYRLSLEWVLLEIKIPKEVTKSPRAMEQVFAGLHGVYSLPIKWPAKFFKGQMPHWFSFEMVGKGGEIHFYIRTQKKYKNVVEAQVYAQYPEAEVYEVPDYINDMPMHLPNDQYDLWGTDLILNKEDAYPIRTYPDFEEKSAGKEDVKRLDPMASLSELFTTLHAGEQIWVQIMGAPTGDGWVKRGQLVLDKIMGKEASSLTGNLLSDAIFAIDSAISGVVPSPVNEKGEKIEKKKEKERVSLSPGKQDIIKAMEKSWDKLGYQTGIRFLYIGPKDNFQQSHVAGIVGAFRQFSSQNLNGFKMNKYTLTFAKGLFKKSKLFNKKISIFQAFRERKLFGTGFTPFVLNTEELATIFHFPDVGVRAPLLPRVETKRGEPPVGLPIN